MNNTKRKTTVNADFKNPEKYLRDEFNFFFTVFIQLYIKIFNRFPDPDSEYESCKNRLSRGHQTTIVLLLAFVDLMIALNTSLKIKKFNETEWNLIPRMISNIRGRPVIKRRNIYKISKWIKSITVNSRAY